MPVSAEMSAKIAKMTAAERDEMIAELEATLQELRIPIPQPYPKWITLEGQPPQIVEDAEQEARVRGSLASTDDDGAKKKGAHDTEPDTSGEASSAPHSRRASTRA